MTAIKRGHIKRVFPGGNTSVGFFSFYDYIAPPDATRIFVIKGGPGVGKSTFIRGIGEALVGRGLDIEFHHCSSDNNSLDGLYIPAIKVALIDGTAPHSVVTNVDTRRLLRGHPRKTPAITGFSGITR